MIFSNAWHNFLTKFKNKVVYSNFFHLIFLEFFWGETFTCKLFISIFYSITNFWWTYMVVQRNRDYSKFPDDTIFARFDVFMPTCINFDAFCIFVESTFEWKLQTVYWICWVHSQRWILIGFPFASSIFEIKLFLQLNKLVYYLFLRNVFCVVFITKLQNVTV